jgi:uncharacterized protein (DUF427 family)
MRQIDVRGMFMKAIWNNQIIAESEETVMVEGNHYFPSDAINKEYFKESSTTTNCPWKGEAHYYSLSVNDSDNIDAAWYYPVAKEKAKNIEGMVAFWRGVKVAE